VSLFLSYDSGSVVATLIGQTHPCHCSYRDRHSFTAVILLSPRPTALLWKTGPDWATKNCLWWQRGRLTARLDSFA